MQERINELRQSEAKTRQMVKKLSIQRDLKKVIETGSLERLQRTVAEAAEGMTFTDCMDILIKIYHTNSLKLAEEGEHVPQLKPIIFSDAGRASDSPKPHVPLTNTEDSCSIESAEPGRWSLEKSTGVLTIRDEEGKVTVKAHVCAPEETARLEPSHHRYGMTDAEGKTWSYPSDLAEKYSAGIFESIQFNPPGILPPVPCQIIVKIPKGTKVYPVTDDVVDIGETGMNILCFATRTKHLQDRNGELEYILGKEGSSTYRVQGKFEWTYP